MLFDVVTTVFGSILSPVRHTLWLLYSAQYCAQNSMMKKARLVMTVDRREKFQCRCVSQYINGHLFDYKQTAKTHGV